MKIYEARRILVDMQVELPNTEMEKRRAIGVALSLIDDKLLKAEQPRLYERSELHPFTSTESIVFFESVGMGIIPGLITTINEPYYANILIVNGCTTDEITWTMDYYGRYWRCWTARPTDEQRNAVPWKDGEQE